MGLLLIRTLVDQNKQLEYITALRELVTDVCQYMFDLLKVNSAEQDTRNPQTNR